MGHRGPTVLAAFSCTVVLLAFWDARLVPAMGLNQTVRLGDIGPGLLAMCCGLGAANQLCEEATWRVQAARLFWSTVLIFAAASGAGVIDTGDRAITIRDTVILTALTIGASALINLFAVGLGAAAVVWLIAKTQTGSVSELQMGDMTALILASVACLLLAAYVARGQKNFDALDSTVA